jgi:membrane protease YdiL (CAAX protease family)
VKSLRILLETILVAGISLLGIWLLPSAKTLFALIPIVYLLVERPLRHRTWSDLGFKFHTFWPDLRANWVWFILVALISQPVTGYLAKVFYPEYLNHVVARLPFGEGIGWAVLLPLLAISLMGEELTYRTLIQGRLTPFLGIPLAIITASLLFGFAHFAPGPFGVVAIDIGMIFIDSILYGVIYARSGNIVVSWLAHFVGDILGLIVILSL